MKPSDAELRWLLINVDHLNSPDNKDSDFVNYNSNKARNIVVDTIRAELQRRAAPASVPAELVDELATALEHVINCRECGEMSCESCGPDGGGHAVRTLQIARAYLSSAAYGREQAQQSKEAAAIDHWNDLCEWYNSNIAEECYEKRDIAYMAYLRGISKSSALMLDIRQNPPPPDSEVVVWHESWGFQIRWPYKDGTVPIGPSGAFGTHYMPLVLPKGAAK